MDASAAEDRVVPIKVLEPDVDHPLPIVLAKDGTVILSYMAFLARRDVHVMRTFHTAFAHRFGPPDRGALASHPLAARGLKADGAFEVTGSSWVRGSFGGKGRHYGLHVQGRDLRVRRRGLRRRADRRGRRRREADGAPALHVAAERR